MPPHALTDILFYRLCCPEAARSSPQPRTQKEVDVYTDSTNVQVRYSDWLGENGGNLQLPPTKKMYLIKIVLLDTKRILVDQLATNEVP